MLKITKQKMAKRTKHKPILIQYFLRKVALVLADMPSTEWMAVTRSGVLIGLTSSRSTPLR
jgi:hypothetical protein